MPRFTLERLLANVLLATLLWCGGASAAHANVEEEAVALYRAYAGVKQHDGDLEVDADLALSVQEFFIALLRPQWGLDVGYVSGEPSGGMSALPTGILLENMFTGTRSTITRAFGIDMHAAGELVFRVSSTAINEASTRHEALAALHSVIPAVRMTDRLLGEDSRDSGANHVAANLEIRMFVFGSEIHLSSDADWIERLQNVSVELLDQDKAQVAASASDARRVHPLDAVLHLCHSLNDRGITVRENDVLGVGVWTPGYPVADLERLAANFTGLEPHGPVQVYMGFR